MGVCAGPTALDCEDGNACTADSCDPISGCVNDDAPATDCLTAGKSSLLIRDNTSNDGKDKLPWKWIKGAELDQSDFADPTDSDGYTLCVYVRSALPAP
jgi:Dictyostelium (slime mold) repeat